MSKFIMMVDDTNIILKTGEMFLKSAGYEVALLKDGFSAIAALQERKPDLILLDVLMPKLDGHDTCRIIKSSEEFQDIPIIMLSGLESPFDKVKGKMLGCDDYLTKPFKKDNLLNMIKKHLPE